MEAVDMRDIERMMRRTGGDEEQCRFFLEASGGDFERAVDMFQGMAKASLQIQSNI